jgi:hypothetical protein
MADDKEWSWQPPNKDAKGSEKISWLNDAVSVGELNNQSKSGYQDLKDAISMIDGRSLKQPSESRSQLSINRGKRALKEVIANIADIRSVDAFTTDNAALKDYLAMQNKIWKAVYFESKFPRAVKRATQWLTAGGYAFISPVYRNLRLSAKSAKAIQFDVFSRTDVLSFQMPEDNNIQGAYAHTIVRFMPNFEAHAKFPLFQHKLKPMARRRYSGNAAKDRLTLAERFRVGDNPTGDWLEQNNEIRYTYVNDLGINTTGKPIPMGPPGALESYIVPFVGQEIPTADMNQGVRVMRKATEEDCYLYPNKRLFISQRGMDTTMYDGPAFDWHGMFPLARFSADEWPWEEGYSLARDIFSVTETESNLERGMDQTAKQRFDPAIIYDKNGGLPRKSMETFDPYQERGRLGVDGEITDKLLRTALPKELLEIPGWGFEYAKYLDAARDYVLGQNAMSNLAKAKLGAASGDVLEKALEMGGPIVSDVSHGYESPTGELMEMVMYLVLQYYPTGRIMQYVGPDGVSREVFDLDPASLVPSHMPDEDPANSSIYTRMERTKMFCSNIHAQITPGSLHGVVQTPQKLLLMQLQRSGFPIDSETVADALDLPNYGTIPGNTIREKWANEQKEKLEFMEKMKELGASLGPGGQPQPGAGGSGGQKKPGRPPSGNRPPMMKTKAAADGPRAVISESG